MSLPISVGGKTTTELTLNSSLFSVVVPQLPPTTSPTVPISTSNTSDLPPSPPTTTKTTNSSLSSSSSVQPYQTTTLTPSPYSEISTLCTTTYHLPLTSRQVTVETKILCTGGKGKGRVLAEDCRVVEVSSPLEEAGGGVGGVLGCGGDLLERRSPEAGRKSRTSPSPSRKQKQQRSPSSPPLSPSSPFKSTDLGGGGEQPPPPPRPLPFLPSPPPPPPTIVYSHQSLYITIHLPPSTLLTYKLTPKPSSSPHIYEDLPTSNFVDQPVNLDGGCVGDGAICGSYPFTADGGISSSSSSSSSSSDERDYLSSGVKDYTAQTYTNAAFHGKVPPLQTSTPLPEVILSDPQVSSSFVAPPSCDGNSCVELRPTSIAPVAVKGGGVVLCGGEGGEVFTVSFRTGRVTRVWWCDNDDPSSSDLVARRSSSFESGGGGEEQTEGGNTTDGGGRRRRGSSFDDTHTQNESAKRISSIAYDEQSGYLLTVVSGGKVLRVSSCEFPAAAITPPGGGSSGGKKSSPPPSPTTLPLTIKLIHTTSHQTGGDQDTFFYYKSLKFITPTTFVTTCLDLTDLGLIAKVYSLLEVPTKVKKVPGTFDTYVPDGARGGVKIAQVSSLSVPISRVMDPDFWFKGGGGASSYFHHGGRRLLLPENKKFSARDVRTLVGMHSHSQVDVHPNGTSLVVTSPCHLELQVFVVWDWLSNVTGLVLSGEGASGFSMACFGDYGKCLHHVHGNGNENAVHEQNHHHFLLDTYDLVTVSPPQSYHVTLGNSLVVNQTSPLFLGTKMVGFPSASPHETTAFSAAATTTTATPTATSPENNTSSTTATVPGLEVNWNELKVPPAYTASNGSLTIAAIGRKRGRCLAVAANRGLCIYDNNQTSHSTKINPLVTATAAVGCSGPDVTPVIVAPTPRSQVGKWRMFGSLNEEMKVKVVAMNWWEKAGLSGSESNEDVLVCICDSYVARPDGSPKTSSTTGRSKYRICAWSRRRLALGNDELIDSVFNQNSSDLSCHLPVGLIPLSTDLFPQPDTVSKDGNGDRALFFVCNFGQGVNFAMYRLQKYTAVLSKANVREQLNVNSSGGTGGGRIVGRADATTRVFAQLVSTSYLSPETHLDFKFASGMFFSGANFSWNLKFWSDGGCKAEAGGKGDMLQAGMGLIRVGGGLSSVLLSNTGNVLSVKSVLKAAVTATITKTTPTSITTTTTTTYRNVGKYWIGDEKRGGHVNAAGDTVWTIALTDGDIRSWTVPNNYCYCASSIADVKELQEAHGVVSSSLGDIGEGDGICDSSRTNIALGPLPHQFTFQNVLSKSHTGSVIYAGQRCRLNGVISSFSISDLRLGAPAYSASLLTDCMVAAYGVSAVMTATSQEEVNTALLEARVARSHAQEIAKTLRQQCNQLAQAALRYIILRSITMVELEKKKVGENSNLRFAKAVLAEAVTVARYALPFVSFGRFFIGLARQIEPSQQKLFFPLPDPTCNEGGGGRRSRRNSRDGGGSQDGGSSLANFASALSASASKGSLESLGGVSPRYGGGHNKPASVASTVGSYKGDAGGGGNTNTGGGGSVMDGGETIEDLSSLCARCGDIVGATNALPLFASRLHAHRKCLTLLEHIVEVVGNNGVVSATSFDGPIISEENALLPSLFSFCQRIEITSKAGPNSNSPTPTKRRRSSSGGSLAAAEELDRVVSNLRESDTLSTPRAKNDGATGQPKTPTTEERKTGMWGYISGFFSAENENKNENENEERENLITKGSSEEFRDAVPPLPPLPPPRPNRSSPLIRRKSIDDSGGVSDVESVGEEGVGGHGEGVGGRVLFNNLSLNSPHINKGVRPDEVLGAAGLVYAMCNFWVHEYEGNKGKCDAHELNVIRARAVAFALARGSDDGDLWSSLARSQDSTNCKLYDLLEGLMMG